ncbi:MAG: hypothetical protein CSA84_04670 [Actinomycetales bacterium]|nr:MAG: hypothetical protein CSA84_04670 [Actinomycetales bacterium]
MLPEARGSSAGEIVYRGTLESRPRDSNESDSNLDPWYWKMEGQGTGSIDPSGTHAFSGLLGVYPTSICWAAFHGTASPLIVIQNYKLKVWSPLMSLKIHGSWDKIFTHFSKAAGAGVLWFSAGIKHEINEMVKKGDIEVEMIVDQTLPNSKQIAKQMQERSDLVFTKFMEQAQRVIFDPPMPQVEAAHASSGGGLFGLFGGGCALNYRRDTTRLSLSYEETSQFAYLQDHTISSSLAGMFDEMHADPEAERKYFQTVYLDDWPRRLARVVRPVVPWRDATVDFVSVQVGYPNTNGAINWEGHSFSDTDGNDGTWKFQTAQKALSDVSSPPASWKPDLTFVKRKVHLAEPPSEIEDPYRRVQIERNVIDLDSGPRGSLINDTTLEVRADSAGRLAVGPIQLGVMLTDASQVVEAVFEATDPDGEPLGLAPVRFRWNHSDVDTDRTWTIFTGDPDFRPFYRYQVSVTVKGTLFEPGRAWTGPWVSANGNGPLVIDIPRPGDDGVVTRSIPEARVAALRALTRGTAESHPVERNVAETTGVAEDKTVVRFRNYQV